jgi:heme exporter protein C
MVDIPIVYMANQWWRTQHPAPVLSGEGSIDPSMRFVLYFSLFAFLLVAWCLIRMRARLEALRRETDGLRRSVHAI